MSSHSGVVVLRLFANYVPEIWSIVQMQTPFEELLCRGRTKAHMYFEPIRSDFQFDKNINKHLGKSSKKTDILGLGLP